MTGIAKKINEINNKYGKQEFDHAMEIPWEDEIDKLIRKEHEDYIKRMNSMLTEIMIYDHRGKGFRTYGESDPRMNVETEWKYDELKIFLYRNKEE